MLYQIDHTPAHPGTNPASGSQAAEESPPGWPPAGVDRRGVVREATRVIGFLELVDRELPGALAAYSTAVGTFNLSIYKLPMGGRDAVTTSYHNNTRICEGLESSRAVDAPEGHLIRLRVAVDAISKPPCCWVFGKVSQAFRQLRVPTTADLLARLAPAIGAIRTLIPLLDRAVGGIPLHKLDLLTKMVQLRTNLANAEARLVHVELLLRGMVAAEASLRDQLRRFEDESRGQ